MFSPFFIQKTQFNHCPQPITLANKKNSEARFAIPRAMTYVTITFTLETPQDLHVNQNQISNSTLAVTSTYI